MKTNVTLKRHSIQGIEVLQRTSDGYFNITELTKAFNAYFCTNKRVDKFFDNQQTKDFIAEIYKQEVLGNEPPKEGDHSLTTNEPPKEGVHLLTTNEPSNEGVHSLTTNEPSNEGVHSLTTNEPSNEGGFKLHYNSLQREGFEQRHHCLLSQDTTCVSWSLWCNVGSPHALPQIHDVPLTVL